MLHQKWGVRNGPPYPLDREVKQRVYGKGSSSNSRNTERGSVLIPVALGFTSAALQLVVTKLINKAFTPKIIRDQQRKIKESEKLKKAIAKVENKRLSESTTGLNELKKIEAEHSKEDDMKAVNPNYDKEHGIGNTNCVICSLCYDLRRRDYDVEASALVKPLDDKVTTSLYKNAKIEKVGKSYDRFTCQAGNEETDKARAKEMIQELKKLPADSSGMLLMDWMFGGGHAVAYEMDKTGITVRDAQSNETWKNDEAVDLLQSAYQVYTMRTDNLEPDIEYIKKSRMVLEK